MISYDIEITYPTAHWRIGASHGAHSHTRTLTKYGHATAEEAEAAEHAGEAAGVEVDWVRCWNGWAIGCTAQVSYV